MSEKNEWKPIESAPKDGSEFLACYTRQGNVTQIVKWNTLHGHFASKGEWLPGFTANATHWMPLPAAPGSTSSAPGDAQDERQAFEAWSKRANQGYDLTPNVSGRMATYESNTTEHAYRGFFHGMNAPAAGDALDAARWRAFIGCARIRPLGSAGLEQPDPNNYAHMGLEIWTVYGRDYSPELLTKMDAENERGRRWLVMFADVARAALAAQVPHKGDAA